MGTDHPRLDQSQDPRERLQFLSDPNRYHRREQNPNPGQEVTNSLDSNLSVMLNALLPKLNR